MRILVVVQARMGSTRLPGKILLPLAGAPMLSRQIERMRAAATPFELVVATTHDPADDAVHDLCRRLGVRSTSGHPTDLLDRHYQAARQAGAEVVVKIPSDCPLIDPDAIDRVLGYYLRQAGSYDFVSNLHPASWPDGNDVEVLPFAILETAWKEAARPLEREHTTPFVWDQPERFRAGNVLWETGEDFSMSHRFTVDYPEDHAFAAAVFDALWTPARPVFPLAEILALLDARPEILAVNQRYAGVNWYRHHLGELATVAPSQTRSPAPAAAGQGSPRDRREAEAGR
ncbi:MAG TPA: glycosyltransferase family protein [Thermoanaerobaculia bacterium]|nr:glycosyltransferase family protein [Thermoanaerobaculia bacterium]